MDDTDEKLLNKQLENSSKCRHWNKYKLNTLVNNKKRLWHHIIMEEVGCRSPRVGCSEDFQKCQRYYEAKSIFSKIKDLVLELFWRRNPSLTFFRSLAEPFEQRFLGKRFCFNISQRIIVFTNRLALLFCETNLITRKSVFRGNLRSNKSKA